MSNRQPPRLLGAFVALAASALVVLSLILPLFVTTISMRDVHALTETYSAWGRSSSGTGLPYPTVYEDSPTHAIPMLFATLLLITATAIAFVRAGSTAGRSAVPWLTMAAAFVAGVAISVVPQLITWNGMFPASFGRAMGVQVSAGIGLGFWGLAVGSVLAVAAAALAAMPVREPEAAEVAPPPGDAEPSGTA